MAADARGRHCPTPPPARAAGLCVRVTVADLWSRPAPDAGRVSQVLLGTPLVVIAASPPLTPPNPGGAGAADVAGPTPASSGGSEGADASLSPPGFGGVGGADASLSPPGFGGVGGADDFLYVEGPDRYRGWIRREETHAGPAPSGELYLIGLPVAPLFPGPEGDEACGELFLGTRVAAAEREGGRRRLLLPEGSAWVEGSALRPPASPDDPVDVACLLDDARSLLGVPYLWGGNTARGIDCSGFVQLVYGMQGRCFRRDAHLQTRHGRAVPIAALAAGDLVFFGRGRGELPTHIGIFLGGGEYIHAAGRELQRVAISPLAEALDAGTVWGARRPG